MFDLLATVTQTQRREVTLLRAPEGWPLLLLLLALAGICALVVWLYRREARAGSSPRLRIGLACLRCAVLLALALVWLEPTIATYIVRTLHARVIVLVDVSASMSIRDAIEPGQSGENAGGTRLENVAALLTRDDAAWLRRLAARNELAVRLFGEQSIAVAPPGDAGSTSRPAAEGLPPLNLTDPPLAARFRTDLSQAVVVALEESGGAPIAGLIVLSDGGLNKGPAVEEIAGYARRFKAPVYAVGVGSPREPPNLRISNLTAPATATPGDPFELRVEVDAAGIEPGEVELELTVQRVSSDGTTADPTRLARRMVTVGAASPPAAQLFEVLPPGPGEYLYRARLQPLPAEALLVDNVRQATVNVLDEKLRVLLVAGRPSYEYRFVATLLERDKTIDVSCWLQSADAQAIRDGDTIIPELPAKPEELFAYDAVLLMDANPAGLESSWAVNLQRFVDEFGGGVLFQAGPHYASRLVRDPRLQEFVALLPVAPDPDADVRLSDQGSFRTRADALRVPEEARAHPLLRFEMREADNAAIWDALPGVWWHLPVLREKPLAEVLLRLGGSDTEHRFGAGVLMAAQPVGAGRTVFLGFDNTWRWRSTGETYFNRFWVQMVRYLAQARRQGSSKRGTLLVDRDVVNLGEHVKVEARVLDETFAPWHQPTIELEVRDSDGESSVQPLAAIPDREGWFGGRVALEREGVLTLRTPLPGGGAPLEYLVRNVRVDRPDVEMRQLRLRADLLEQLAEQTGGRYLALDQAAALPDEIENARQVQETRGPATPLWDHSATLLLLSGLLGIEWLARRRSQLL